MTKRRVEWSDVKGAIRSLTPPVLYDGAKRLATSGDRGPVEYEYVPQGWQAEAVDPRIKGWNVQGILDTYKANWPGFVEQLRGSSPLGMSPEAPAGSAENLAHHNLIMSYAYALCVATRNRSSVTMLDYGGGIGHYYVISKALAPDVMIDYYCRDLPLLAGYGQTLFPEAHFSSDDSYLERRYDFVLASSSLHYSRDWTTAFANLASVATGHVFVTRVPIVRAVPSFVFVQRPYGYGYDTEYLGWCLNRDEFLESARGAGLQLVREFMAEIPPNIHHAPEQCESRGFLFHA